MVWNAENVGTSSSEGRILPMLEDASEVGRTARREVQPATLTPASQPSASVHLMSIVNWDGKSPGIKQTLAAAFQAANYLDCIRNLHAREIEPLLYINNLDKVIDTLPVGSDLQKRCIRALKKTCGFHEILPTSYTIPYELNKSGPHAHTYGDYCDIWKLAGSGDPDRIFAVRAFRVEDDSHIKEIYKIFCTEVIARRRIIHPNILKFEGVAPSLFEFSIVSEWMPNGSAVKYISNHPEVNRLELLIGVVRGLTHMHHHGVVHGDLTTRSVLIDAKGSPRISGFDFCSLAGDLHSVNASAPNDQRTIRYCAPELLHTAWMTETDAIPTNKSDVYSLSMVVVEFMTGNMPFPDSTDLEVIFMVLAGRRPRKPRCFIAPVTTPEVWSIAQECWNQNAEQRLGINCVPEGLERIASFDANGCGPSMLEQSLLEFGKNSRVDSKSCESQAATNWGGGS